MCQQFGHQILTFWSQNICQFDWLDILYFQAMFDKETVRAHKVIVKFVT